MDLELSTFRESGLPASEAIISPAYSDTDAFIRQGTSAAESNLTDYFGKEFVRIASYVDSWTQFASYSARIVELRQSGIVIEMIIDSETQRTEDRLFDEKMFEGIPRVIGQFLKVKCYERKNCQMIQITNGDGLVRPEDFPKINFDKFLDNPLF